MTKEEAVAQVKEAREAVLAAEKEIKDAQELRAFILSIPGQTLTTILAALRGTANNFYTRDPSGDSIDRNNEAFQLNAKRADEREKARDRLAGALYQLDRIENPGGAA